MNLIYDPLGSSTRAKSNRETFSDLIDHNTHRRVFSSLTSLFDLRSVTFRFLVRTAYIVVQELRKNDLSEEKTIFLFLYTFLDLYYISFVGVLDTFLNVSLSRLKCVKFDHACI